MVREIELQSFTPDTERERERERALAGGRSVESWCSPLISTSVLLLLLLLLVKRPTVAVSVPRDVVHTTDAMKLDGDSVTWSVPRDGGGGGGSQVLRAWRVGGLSVANGELIKRERLL